MDDSKLYIPMGLKKNKEHFTGFGNTEMMQTIVTIVALNIINLMIYFIIRSTIFSSVFFLTSAAGSIMFYTKDFMNLSIFDRISNLIEYNKSQKKYEYIALDEWR